VLVDGGRREEERDRNICMMSIKAVNGVNLIMDKADSDLV